jgi:hypothetical protein
MVRLQPAELAEPDAWIAAQHDPKLTRPEALLRRAFGESKR